MNLVEKAYTTNIQSPIGPIGIGFFEKGVLCVHVDQAPNRRILDILESLGYGIERGSHPTGEILEREFREYFEGRRRVFTIPPRFHGTPFQILVWKTLCQVPMGQLLSYGELATKAGRPQAARAVGRIMGQNRIPILVPCHRILAANGSLGGYGYGLEIKRRLLQLEGVSGL